MVHLIKASGKIGTYRTAHSARGACHSRALASHRRLPYDILPVKATKGTNMAQKAGGLTA
jgi:hypothetical protein